MTSEKTGILNDGLNDEQSSKKKIVIENEDESGKVKRQRVSDQTVFDKMFIEGLIGIGHHEASHNFIDDLARSGTSVPSLDLSKQRFSGKFSGSNHAEKRMIFSSAFRSISEYEEQSDLKVFMRISSDPYHGELVKATGSRLEDLADKFIPILELLCSHYRITPKKDPREILFSQMYRSVPKKHI